jgi:hypothetical protein
MFTFENLPLVIILALIIAAWLSFLSVVPWGNLF